MKFNLFGYDVHIKKHGKETKIARRPWTPSEINALLRFRNEGKNWREIAQLMNRTPIACSTRYSKVKKKEV